jgi:phosphoenolpyruvate carboxykinase (ATP)
LNGQLNHVEFETHPVFGVKVPTSCPGIPVFVLNPRENWRDKNAYDAAAQTLAQQFLQNFEKFREMATPDILAGAPIALEPAV